MAGESENPARTRAIVMYVLLGVWCVVLLLAGFRFLSQPWGPACLGGAVVSGAVVGLGAALRSWVGALYGVLLVAAAMLLLGEVLAGGGLEGGLLALLVVAALAPIALTLRDLTGRSAVGGGGPMPQEMRKLLSEIHENSMLSDNAKRVLFRERELGLFRQAIESDIEGGKYNAALALCDELANVFGYLNEAEAFRGRITQARREHYEQEVGEALDQFGRLLAERDWASVHHEVARIRRLYGDSHLVQDLDQRVVSARDEHKSELESRFLQAAQRDDVEGAMNLLRELDRYLTREEAERLSEVAQGVVVKHRENLGVQFKLAVNDHRWAEAVRIGEEIVDEFPNTKMADEVRSMIDLLRTRATQTAVAGGEVG